MKKGVLDEDGAVRCPKCGSSSFRTKRSFVAKATLIPAVGVGALAAPKRIKCLACGELFKARAVPATQTAPEPAVDVDDDGPRGSLLLVRSLALGLILDAVQQARPDLDRPAARALVKASKTGPQQILADAPLPLVEATARALRKAGAKVEIIPADGATGP